MPTMTHQDTTFFEFEIAFIANTGPGISANGLTGRVFSEEAKRLARLSARDSLLDLW